MSLEWRGSGAVGDGILISTLTAVALPMMPKKNASAPYYQNVYGAQVVRPSPVLTMGANDSPTYFYYSTIAGAVSTIANPSGSVLPLTTTANLTQPYFTL